MRRHRQISEREMNFKHEVKKVKCGNPTCEKEFYKFTSFDRFCPYHRYEVRKKNIMQQTANKRAIKPIKQISDKRAAQNKLYRPLRAEYLLLHPICEVKGCNFKSRDIHHKFDGADRQKYFLDVDTWMAVCRVCHNWIGENPEEAKELGYLN